MSSPIRSIGSGVRDPGHDVLALRVLEELAVEPVLPRRRVAREADARAGALSPLLPKTIWTTLTAVPRSSGISYVRRYTCARRVPGVEDGANGLLQLGAGVLLGNGRHFSA